MLGRRAALLRVWLCGLPLLAAPAPGKAAGALALDIAPGQFDEHCLRIDAGEVIRWRFVAMSAVDFNIHHHRQDKVIYPVRRDDAERASGRFRSRAGDDYCLMWTNKSPRSVRVSGSVERLFIAR